MRPYYIIFSLSLVLTPFAYAQIVFEDIATSTKSVIIETPIFDNKAGLPLYLDLNTKNKDYNLYLNDAKYNSMYLEQ